MNELAEQKNGHVAAPAPDSRQKLNFSEEVQLLG